MSAGGICAFTAAWEHPEAFSKVVSHCGSFVNFRGGHNYPSRIRQSSPKPLRIFLQSGARDLDLIFNLAILEDETKKVDQQMERDLSDIAARKQAVTTLRASLLVSLVAGGAVLLGALFFTGVLVTRRVVGPVFKIKRLLRRVGTGRLVVNERLRRGDELEDLFDTFLQMTYSLTALQRGRLATLDATIARAERAGTSQDVMDGLHALRAQMALGLESKGARS